jgi:threonine synthase
LRSFLTHLECASCGDRYPADQPQTVCRACGRSLLARYDLAGARRILAKTSLASRPLTLWRYRELLPVVREESVVTLGEGFTPLLRLERLGAEIGLPNLWLKDEAPNPTGSFKARGLCLAVSKARELGIRKLLLPSAGNAGAALAAYAAKAGMEACVFLPADTPEANKREVKAYGARLFEVEGTIAHAARWMGELSRELGGFDLSTLKEPYRVEGKKTLGFEIAEQLGWTLPDAIVYPTGGGTGLIGMWKAFQELEALGWIGQERPRLVAVQPAGCAPIVAAWEQGKEESSVWERCETIAAGLRVPKAFADWLILKILHESEGTAVRVSEAEILEALSRLARTEGILACPEGAATLAALRHLKQRGFISPEQVIVTLNTASGLKYLDVLPASLAGA